MKKGNLFERDTLRSKGGERVAKNYLVRDRHCAHRISGELGNMDDVGMVYGTRGSRRRSDCISESST